MIPFDSDSQKVWAVLCEISEHSRLEEEAKKPRQFQMVFM